MGLGAAIGGAANTFMAAKKAKASDKTVNPGSDVTGKATMQQDDAMSGDQSSTVENQYYANGGVIGRPSPSGHCTGASYDAGGRKVGKRG